MRDQARTQLAPKRTGDEETNTVQNTKIGQIWSCLWRDLFYDGNHARQSMDYKCYENSQWHLTITKVQIKWHFSRYQDCE